MRYKIMLKNKMNEMERKKKFYVNFLKNGFLK